MIIPVVQKKNEDTHRNIMSRCCFVGHALHSQMLQRVVKVCSHCVSHATNLFLFLFPSLILCVFYRLCSLTLKKLVVLKELDKELNSLSIAVKIQVSGLISHV